jgi:hypothetical protein
LITWKVQCINCGDKEEENQEEMKTIMKLYCLLLQELVTFVNPKDTRQLIAPRKINQEGGGRGSGRGGSGGRGYQGRGKFMGSCNQCHKFGHRKEDCWEIESNRHKRPEGYRLTEHANVTLDRN